MAVHDSFSKRHCDMTVSVPLPRLFSGKIDKKSLGFCRRVLLQLNSRIF
jgi:hypothetical protein